MRAALERQLRGLASGGVYIANCITAITGGLLHHRFTLTNFRWRFTFCCTVPADCSGWELPTTLLCEVRTFLGVLRQRGDPGDSSSYKDRANKYERETIFPLALQLYAQRVQSQLDPSWI